MKTRVDFERKLKEIMTRICIENNVLETRYVKMNENHKR